jgi:hypothetical protein
MVFAALAVSAVGVGMSAASAAGAFSSKVDSSGPTPEEIKAMELNRQAYEQGRFWQQQLDPMMNRRLNAERDYLKQTNQRTSELGQELRGLNDARYYDQAADRAVNQTWQGYPQALQGVQQTASRSGGPGSGAFMSRMGDLNIGMESAVRGANAQGRLGYLNEHSQMRGQMGQVLGQQLQRAGSYRDQSLSRFSDFQDRLTTGLGLVTGGGQNAAANQQARINAQVQNNIAANAAMGQIGGAMMSVGMSGMNAFGGGAGGVGGAVGAGGGSAPGYVSPGGGRSIY